MLLDITHVGVAYLDGNVEELNRLRRQLITPLYVVDSLLLYDGPGDMSTGYIRPLEYRPGVRDLITSRAAA